MMNTEKTKALGDPRYMRMEETCKPFPSTSYERMDNNRLAVFAIGVLEENGIPRTQEALCVALFLMFPAKFSLVGFPQYPDTERVNRTLLQLGTKYRNWATGNKHVGYTLNDAGHHVLDQTRALLQRPEMQTRKKTTPRERTKDPNAEVREIEISNLFQEFKAHKIDNPSSREYDFWELMQAFPYTPKEALRKRWKGMREAANLAGRKDLADFLEWVYANYSGFFLEGKV